MKSKILENFPRRHALLVEDEKITQLVHRKFLEKLGFKVEVVDHGSTALDRVSKATYDLVLLDLGLPDMIGEFVLTSIRLHESCLDKSPVPIIVATAHGDEAILQSCLQQGANATFQKPMSFNSLAVAWQEIMLDRTINSRKSRKAT